MIGKVSGGKFARVFKGLGCGVAVRRLTVRGGGGVLSPLSGAGDYVEAEFPRLAPGAIFFCPLKRAGRRRATETGPFRAVARGVTDG